MDVKGKIVLAITTTTQVKIRYYKKAEKKEEEYSVVYPYLLGVNQKGNCVLSAYYMTENQPIQPNWKTFLLDYIKEVELLDKTFNCTAIGYNKNDVRMKIVLCKVPKSV